MLNNELYIYIFFKVSVCVRGVGGWGGVGCEMPTC